MIFFPFARVEVENEGLTRNILRISCSKVILPVSIFVLSREFEEPSSVRGWNVRGEDNSTLGNNMSAKTGEISFSLI